MSPQLFIKRSRVKTSIIFAGSLLVAASCGGADSIGSNSADGGVAVDSATETTLAEDSQVADDVVVDDASDSGASADADDQSADQTIDEQAEDTDKAQDAPGPNATLLSEPQTSAELHEVLKEISSGGEIAAANKLTFFPEIPIPEGASFFGYETDISRALFDGALGQTRFEYFFEEPIADVTEAFVAEMEGAGWEVDQDEQSGTSVLTVTVPNQQFPMNMSIYGAQYRGATLAILTFGVNGAPYDQNGYLEVWSGLADEFGILMPEDSTPAGGGAITYREPVGSEEAIDPAGDYLLITNEFPEPAGAVEHMEAFATYAEGQGFETVLNGSEVSLVKDGEATTYKFDPQRVTVKVELPS